MLAYDINPDVLKWARKRAGYNKDTIAKRLNITQKELTQIERGELPITLKQLRKLGKYYKRANWVFYLDKVPEDLDIPDFRKQKIQYPVSDVRRSLNIKMRELFEKKKYAEELAKRLGLNLDYSFLSNIQLDKKDASQKLRSFLDINTSDLQELKDYDVLNYWKSKVEEKNILVFQFQYINLKEARGFAISDTPFPLIALNQKDTYYARVFTLIHELSHIFLKNTALCNPTVLEEHNSETETLCNRISAQVLVPQTELKEKVKVISDNSTNITFRKEKKLIQNLSDYFKVSYSVILYRMNSLNLIEYGEFKKLEKWINKIGEKRKEKEESEGGGNFYTNYFSKTSKNYLDLVFDSLHSNEIQYHDALKYIDEKRSTFDEIHKKYIDKMVSEK